MIIDKLKPPAEPVKISALAYLFKYAPNIIAIFCSAYLAGTGFSGWYWFLIVAVLV